MNLYLLKRREEASWDQYVGFVVCASSPDEARDYPMKFKQLGDEGDIWANAILVDCTFIGTAAPSVKLGIVLDSFKHG